MVFCNLSKEDKKVYDVVSHNPYFSRWFSAIMKINIHEQVVDTVTILILVDGFLQWGSGIVGGFP